MSSPYSTQNVSTLLIDEILHALKNVGAFGSVEIYIQNNTVTQITMRNIKKTNVDTLHLNHVRAAENKPEK